MALRSRIWDGIPFLKPHPVFTGIDQGHAVYFVHSYHLKDAMKKGYSCQDYGGPLVAAPGDNMIGMQ